MPAPAPSDLVPAHTHPMQAANSVLARAAQAYAMPALAQQGMFGATLHRAALTAGADYRDLEFRTLPDEVEPRLVLKNGVKEFPRAQSEKKSDPFVGLRPTFDAKLRRGGSFATYAAQRQMLFNRDVLAFEGFTLPDQDESLMAIGESEHAEQGEALTPAAASIAAQPQRAQAALVSMTTPRHFDGATPRVPRAVALSSVTPVPAGNIEVVSAHDLAPKSAHERQTTVAQRAAPARPNYAQLIEDAKSPRQQHCLAQAIYFEARSEPEAGQAAVAQVVINRVLSGLYPASVCGVVFQNSHRHLACQFTFTCEGKSLRITDQTSWERAQRIARDVLNGTTYLSQVGRSTHYHATYVRPGWSRRLERAGQIGTHIFYRLKPGQT
ncbi:MAG: cell wall hydrolase [Alphaproteobacteria bacterium]|nr:cell wall hydrolase [Alphaproteobacteria bacterium]